MSRFLIQPAFQKQYRAILQGSDFADFPSPVVPVYISRGMLGKQEGEQVALSSQQQNLR